MSSKPEPVIWSCDAGQQIPCCDSCQLTITRMSNIKDVPMLMVLLSYFSGQGGLANKQTDGRTCIDIYSINGLPNFLRYGAPLTHQSSTRKQTDTIKFYTSDNRNNYELQPVWFESMKPFYSI